MRSARPSPLGSEGWVVVRWVGPALRSPEGRRRVRPLSGSGDSLGEDTPGL